MLDHNKYCHLHSQWERWYLLFFDVIRASVFSGGVPVNVAYCHCEVVIETGVMKTKRCGFLAFYVPHTRYLVWFLGSLDNLKFDMYLLVTASICEVKLSELLSRYNKIVGLF